MFGIKFNKEEWDKDWNALKQELEEKALLVKDVACKGIIVAIDKADESLESIKSQVSK